MSDRKGLLARWRADYDFKTTVSAAGSLAATTAFALYNGFLGVWHASLWHGAVCVYYLVLVLLRGLVLTAERKAATRPAPEQHRQRVYVAAAALLLLLNSSLVVPATLMATQQKPVSLTLIPAIAMATYTTYKIVMASIHLKKRSASADVLVKLLRTISFIDALVSILTLQSTLITINAEGSDLLPLTAATSAAVLLAVLSLSVAALAAGIRRVRKGSDQPGN